MNVLYVDMSKGASVYVRADGFLNRMTNQIQANYHSDFGDSGGVVYRINGGQRNPRRCSCHKTPLLYSFKCS